MTLQAGVADPASSADEEPLDRVTLDAVLDWLLAHDPPLQAMAVAENGLTVPMPPDVPVLAGNVMEAAGYPLAACAPADLTIIVDAWERARRTGGGQAVVHLRSDAERSVLLHFVDARYRYGVFLVFFMGNLGDVGAAGTESSLFRPRMCTLWRDELSVVCDVDDATIKVLGRSRAELLGTRTLDLLHPDDRPLAIANWMEMLERPDSKQRTLARYLRGDGSYVWLESTSDNRLADADSKRVITQMVDVSDRMDAVEALRASERLLRRLTETLPIGIVQIDGERHIVHANERLGAIVGVAAAVTIDEQFAFAAAIDRERFDVALDALLEHGIPADIELALDLPEGRRHCSVALRELSSDRGAVRSAIACVADITEDVRLREELQRRVTFDDLTQCYNRAAILEKLASMLPVVDRLYSGIAALFLDLNGFKETNDLFGHAAGDALLRGIGERLLAGVRGNDLVGRLGGDEFLIICRDVATPEAAQEMAGRIADAVAQATDLGTATITPTSSIGVAWTDVPVDPDAFVARADAAMYESKRLGTGPVLAQSRAGGG
jgi:diguanylate cyclase (GGDEF)-like protein/PAS domain S-box-containing protein